MVCSPEQLAANRRNSKLSSGPSASGKLRSRRNGLKHGLTGAGVVIPDEDLAAVEERFEAFEADLKPANDVARFLARRAALLSVRLDRAAREEAARITRDMLEAAEVEEDLRAMELDELARSLADHPVDAVRRLRRSEEGIAWLVEGWRLARLDLLDCDGARWRLDTALRLAGLDPERAAASRAVALHLAAMQGRFDRLGPADWPDLPPEGRRAAAKLELLAWVDRQVAGLEEARKALDHEVIARARAGAAARAIFDASKGSTLARKYEAAAERDFYRALKKIEEINAAEADAEAVEEPAQTNEEAEACDELASSFPSGVRGFDAPKHRGVGSGNGPGTSNRADRPGVRSTETPATRDDPPRLEG